MKHIYLVLSLGLLLFAASCNGKSGNGNQPANNTPEIVTDAVQYYYTISDDEPAITGEMKDGALFLTFKKDLITPIGVADEESFLMPDFPVVVEGLKGDPKNFIIADIGQDYNPILCVLTDQGVVQILSLWDVVSKGDLEPTVLSMDPIIGFKAGPGGPWEDEDGEINYDYTTIYGIDAQGGQHEIMLYTWGNNLEHILHAPTGTLSIQLLLSQDWKMRYIVGFCSGVKLEEYQGRFWPIKEDWDNMVFRYGYELTTRLQFLDEGTNYTEELVQGVFELYYPEVGDQSCMITPIEGVDFCESGLNEPVPFDPFEPMEENE